MTLQDCGGACGDVQLKTDDDAPCPVGYKCFSDGPAFVSAVNVLPRPAAREKLALLCPASKPCDIKCVQLCGSQGLRCKLLLANVALQDQSFDGSNGGLLNIDGGSVQAVNVSFFNGESGDGYVGSVMAYNSNFSCVECSFSKCSATYLGGGVRALGDLGYLRLMRPVFGKENSCTAGKAACGAGCFCVGCFCAGTNASARAGCTCKTAGAPNVGFVCE